MQLQFFTVPVRSGEEETEALNRFLGGHRILAIDRFFIQDGANSAWSLCISFEPAAALAGRPQAGGKRGGGVKVDYRDVLNEQDFAVFARLRDLRKDLAEAEGVPAYAIFTNEQLSEMVQRRVRTMAALVDIKGVGEARAEKHGKQVLDLLRRTDAVPTSVPVPVTVPIPAPDGEAGS